MPRDGKSTVASSIGRLMADAGFKVLLIDADLRRPNLHDQFKLNNTLGLADVLHHRASAASVIQPTMTPRLSVVTSGDTRQETEAAIPMGTFRPALKDWQRGFDMVIVDAPALLGPPDVMEVLDVVSTVVLVVPQGIAETNQLQAACSKLQGPAVNPFGVVVNLADRSSTDLLPRQASLAA
jgi:capsular exopolysaccharide synthesis family protein